MQQLNEIIENLKSKDEVDALFLTGSHGLGSPASYSDLDIVVILTKNTRNIRSVYQWVDDCFTDIFFFDHEDIDRVEKAKSLPANSMDAILVSWLEKADIKFDKSGKITSLRDCISSLISTVPKDEQDMFWQKINYNYIANKRYFESDNSSYHEALELRLSYSIPEVITGYFSMRNIPWRGEKAAIKYLKEKDVDFYNLFVQYFKAGNLKQRFETYSILIKYVFPSSYRLHNKDDVIAVSKEFKIEPKLTEYWNMLTS